VNLSVGAGLNVESIYDDDSHGEPSRQAGGVQAASGGGIFARHVPNGEFLRVVPPNHG